MIKLYVAPMTHDRTEGYAILGGTEHSSFELLAGCLHRYGMPITATWQAQSPDRKGITLTSMFKKTFRQ